MKKIVILFLLAIALAVTYSLLPQRESLPGASSEVSNGSPVAKDDVQAGPVLTQVAAPGAIVGESAPIFDSASSVSQLEAVVAASGLEQSQKVEYMRKVAAFCEGKQFASMHPPKREAEMAKARSKAEVESIEYVQQFTKTFCDFSPESFAGLTSKMGEVDSRGDVVQAHSLLNLHNEGEIELARSQAESLIATSNSPDAIEAALNYLIGVNDSGWKMTSEVPVPASVGAGAPDAQRLAIKKLNCSLQGGCGANGFFTIVECDYRGLCRSGATAASVWQQSYSPEVLAYSDALLARLQEIRRR